MVRVFTNRNGVTYDEDRTDIVFAEDLNEIVDLAQQGGNGSVPIDGGNADIGSGHTGIVGGGTSANYIESVYAINGGIAISY